MASISSYRAASQRAPTASQRTASKVEQLTRARCRHPKSQQLDEKLLAARLAQLPSLTPTPTIPASSATGGWACGDVGVGIVAYNSALEACDDGLVTAAANTILSRRRPTSVDTAVLGPLPTAAVPASSSRPPTSARNARSKYLPGNCDGMYTTASMDAYTGACRGSSASCTGPRTSKAAGGPSSGTEALADQRRCPGEFQSKPDEEAGIKIGYQTIPEGGPLTTYRRAYHRATEQVEELRHEPPHRIRVVEALAQDTRLRCIVHDTRSEAPESKGGKDVKTHFTSTTHAEQRPEECKALLSKKHSGRGRSREDHEKRWRRWQIRKKRDETCDVAAASQASASTMPAGQRCAKNIEWYSGSIRLAVFEEDFPKPAWTTLATAPWAGRRPTKKVDDRPTELQQQQTIQLEEEKLRNSSRKLEEQFRQQDERREANGKA